MLQPEPATPGERLRARMFAALNETNAPNMWRGRAISMIHAALSAWLAEDELRPAAGFFEWAGNAQNFADWLEERPRPLDGPGRMGWSGLSAYMSGLPGYQTGQPVGGSSSVMHGYLTMQCFGFSAAQWRYEERLCDDPEAASRLIQAGMAPTARPSEEEALAALAFWESGEISAALESEGALGARGLKGRSWL